MLYTVRALTDPERRQVAMLSETEDLDQASDLAITAAARVANHRFEVREGRSVVLAAYTRDGAVMVDRPAERQVAA
ncbi:MAG: hypothetical protein V7607_1225 [Solirubrobacteraceae bacterium]